MRNNTSKRKALIVAIVTLSCVLAALLGTIFFLQLRDNQKELPEATTAPTETSAETDPTESDQTTQPLEEMTISAGFCDLHFPEQWSDQVRTEFIQSDVGGVVVFYGKAGEKETELFIVEFSRTPECSGNPVGLLSVDGEDVLVCIMVNELRLDGSWTEDELDTISDMRQDVDYLIGRLKELPGFTEEYSDFWGTTEQPGDMEIATPFCMLHYPGTWKDRVWTEFTPSGDGGIVTFYGAVAGEDVPLFAMHFDTKTEDAVTVGYVRRGGSYVEVSMQMMHPDNTDGWAEEDINTLAAMQEGFNDVLMHMQELPEFTAEINNQATEPTVQEPTEEEPTEPGKQEPTEHVPEDELKIITPYVEMNIPEQWAGQIRGEVKELETGHAVIFYGNVAGKETKLFTIFFGTKTETSFPAGILNRDGKSIEVNIEMEDIVSAGSWSDTEMDTLNAMQECINDLMGELAEIPDFDTEV